MQRSILLLLLIILTLAACAPQTDEGITIILVADGAQQTLVLNREATVGEVLERASITLSDLDRVNPPTFTPTEDGMVITVVRVIEEIVVERITLPFGETTVRNDGLPYGETRLLQAGVNGEVEVTYRIDYEDGIEVSRNEVRRVVIIPPQDEVVMVGSAGELPAVTITGTLIYISGGNAWMMRQNSGNKRPLTTGGGLDGRVFSLSPDGKRLLFTRSLDWDRSAEFVPGQFVQTPTPVPTDEEEEGQPAFNTLWTLLDTSDPSSRALELDVENVLYAEWAPGEERTILFSTAESRPSFPGWQANNDLWRARVSANGVVVRKEEVLAPSSGGIYGWYGTNFTLSPDGVTLAWAQSDGMGVLRPVEASEEESDAGAASGELPDAYTRALLLEFAPATLYEDVVWRPELSWSPDGELVVTTTHGAPLGEETPEDSPVYDLTVVSADGSFSANVIRQAGMWSMPQFSPLRTIEDEQTVGWLAFLRSIEPLNSVAGRYQLAIVDRDGSNQRLIYPPEDEAGLLPQIVTWSPDARQIALIHQGDLFVVDVSSGRAQQLSSDGLSSNPRWAQ
jgi:Tol biopolymer transport system component/uncharacterized protein YcfL